MPRPEPMDLDDDEDDRPRRRRAPAAVADPDPYPSAFSLAPTMLLRLAWLGAVAAGTLSVAVAYFATAIWAPAFTATGCFLGIVGRILQAEEARQLAEEREAWRVRRAPPSPGPSGPAPAGPSPAGTTRSATGRSPT